VLLLRSIDAFISRPEVQDICILLPVPWAKNFNDAVILAVTKGDIKGLRDLFKEIKYRTQEPLTLSELRRKAQELGARNYSRLHKEDLQQLIAKEKGK